MLIHEICTGFYLLSALSIQLPMWKWNWFNGNYVALKWKYAKMHETLRAPYENAATNEFLDRKVETLIEWSI